MGIKGVTSGQRSASSSSSSELTASSSGGVKSTVGYVVVPVQEVSGYFSCKDETAKPKQISIDISDRQARQLLKIVAKHAGKLLSSQFYRSIQVILPILNKRQIDTILINYRLAEAKDIVNQKLQLNLLTSRRISNAIQKKHAEIAYQMLKHTKITDQAKSEAKSVFEADKFAKKKWYKMMESTLKKKLAKEKRRQKKIAKNNILSTNNHRSSSQTKAVNGKDSVAAVDSKKLKKHKVKKINKSSKPLSDYSNQDQESS